MITVSILSLVITLFLIHTIFTHLLGWWVREDDTDMTIFAILLLIAEIILCIALLCNILK